MSFRDQFKGGGPNMSDPSTANSRIFVGSIPTHEMTKKDLEERFKKHGPILGIALNRGFGFVQYEEESSALEAIKQENGAVFRGKKMEVNQARVFGAGRRGVDGPGGSRRGDSQDKGDYYRKRSPFDDRGRDRGDRYEGFPGKGGDRDRDRDRDRERDRDRGFYGRDGGFKKDGVL